MAANPLSRAGQKAANPLSHGLMAANPCSSPATSSLPPTSRPFPGPFDLILESVGGQSLTAALRLVARDGTVAVFGNSSGEDSTVSFGGFHGHPHAKLYAFFVYESGEPPTFGADLAFLATEVAAARLHPQVGLESSWRDPVGALEALRQRSLEGKAVLTID